jgi:DNA polymerase III delta prime subunit
MEGVLRRLREGGWKEEEIREMMMNEDDDDDDDEKEKREEHVSVLALTLLRAGWSREDVVYSLGVDVGKSWLDLDFESEEELTTTAATAVVGVNDN